MAEFSEGLEDVLGSLCRRPGRWILIAEVGPSRYWQALAYEDGSLVAEVASNHWREPDDHMTPQEESRLRMLGWEAPDLPGRPNWTRVESTTSPAAAGVALQAVETLGGVLGAGEGEKVVVKLFSSPNRGDTPASPEYVKAPACGGTQDLIDPDGGDGTEDPDFYPDPTADDPPWGED